MRLRNLQIGRLRLQSPHVRSRARIVAPVAALALAVAWGASRLPERSEAAVSEILGRGTGGRVEPTGYVWERSRGAIDDLFLGRGVVFLAKADQDTPSDVWRARVSVTPFGRPLFGRSFSKVTDTQWGDERALTVERGRAAFATWFAGKMQSITVATLDAPEGTVVRHILREPAASAVFELAGDELVVSVGDPPAAAAVDLTTSEVRAEASAELAIAETLVSSPITGAADPFIVTRAEARDAAPEGFEPLAPSEHPGGEPPIVERAASGSHVWIVDTRQLDAALLPGRARPHSDTGWMDAGGVQSGLDPTRIVAAVGLPMSRAVGRSGFSSDGHWFGLIAEGAPSLGVDGGMVRVGEWPFEPWAAPAIAAQWLGPDGGNGRFEVCVTKTGQLAIGWSDAAQGGPSQTIEMPTSCEISVAGNARAPFAGIGPSAFEQWQSTDANRDPLLVFLRRNDGLPRIRLPAGAEWRTPSAIQAVPAWIPSAVEGTVMVLGVPVTVTHFDAKRWEWALMLGDQEKSHRLKGHFPERLTADQTPRARVAFGVGTGKRRKPRGLRIGGSTGHPFGGKEGLLVVGSAGLSLLGPERAHAEPDADATELPLTVAGGALLASARKRGPRQARADVCVLEGGDVLLAEAVFDSQEATATVLVKLGCMGAAALDRGAELPVLRREGARAGVPQEATALVALERPLRGTASAWKPTPAP